MVDVAVAGVPTPLLAVHLYLILLSGGSGLLTFTMVSDDVLESTSGLPTFVHVTLGSGSPDALHFSSKLSPSTTMAVSFEISTDGATTSKLNDKRFE